MERRFTLAACAAALLWLGAAGGAGAQASAGAAPGPLHGRAWMLRHLGARGLEKCRALVRVRRHAEELQKARGGSLSALERRRLDRALTRAEDRPPRSVTPNDCGSAL